MERTRMGYKGCRNSGLGFEVCGCSLKAGTLGSPRKQLMFKCLRPRSLPLRISDKLRVIVLLMRLTRKHALVGSSLKLKP